MPPVYAPDYERLNNAVLPDGFDELVQGIGSEFLTRLERASRNTVQRNVANLLRFRLFC